MKARPVPSVMQSRPAYSARQRRELARLARLAADGSVRPRAYLDAKRLVLDGLSATEAARAARPPGQSVYGRVK